jgi:hypothetical protein
VTVVDPAPAHLADVMSPEWLTAALDDLAAGETVVEAHVVEDYTTVASKIRFEVVIEGNGGQRVNRPYCVKGSFTADRIMNLEIESRFYRELGPTIGLRTPRCVYAGLDENTGGSLFIMNYLVAEGVTFLNSQAIYTPQMTAAALGQLAQLHANTWGEERLAALDWLAPNRPRMTDSIPIEILQPGPSHASSRHRRAHPAAGPSA